MQIQLVGINDADVDLLVKDADGEILASSRGAGKSSEDVRLDLQAGRYFVVVLPKDHSSASGKYQVKVTNLGEGVAPR